MFIQRFYCQKVRKFKEVAQRIFQKLIQCGDHITLGSTIMRSLKLKKKKNRRQSIILKWLYKHFARTENESPQHALHKNHFCYFPSLQFLQTQ